MWHLRNTYLLTYSLIGPTLWRSPLSRVVVVVVVVDRRRAAARSGEWAQHLSNASCFLTIYDVIWSHLI